MKVEFTSRLLRSGLINLVLLIFLPPIGVVLLIVNLIQLLPIVGEPVPAQL